MLLLMTASVVGLSLSQVPRDCDKAPLQGSSLCNESLSVGARAAWIVQQMNLNDKMLRSMTGAAPIARLGVSTYQWWSEALHGLGNSAGVRFDQRTPCATSFPQVITTAASWNASLFRAVGNAIGNEARAFNNVGNAGLTFWAPNINQIRDPRWGRGHETPGEDPFLSSVYAENFVRGMQEGEDPKHIKASACCKHLYAYDLENWGGTDRDHFNAVVGTQDEADTYLPVFYSCVKNAKVSGLMCSYNAVNGVPSCVNNRVMTELARDAWGFEGYITSDCGAVRDVSQAHHYEDPPQAIRDSLGSGMDVDCGNFMSQYLEASVQGNVTPMAVVDRAMRDLFAVQIRLGMFDSAAGQPYLNYTYAEHANTPAHQQLALDAAVQGTVLLKNDGTLPWTRGAFKTIAMVGPNADATTVMQGNYQGVAPYLVSPVQGVSKYATTVVAPGCDTTACGNDGDFGKAVAAAQTADATVMVLGMSTLQESEGHDRTDIALPGNQPKLVQQVTAAAKGPVVVVVMAGGSVDMTPLKNNSKVRAVLWVGYPGQSGGDAIAQVLFGDRNPGGRLPHTQYPADYINGLSMFDMGMRPNTSLNNTGRTYRFYTGTPSYEFGAGLSYTTFSREAAASVHTVSAAHVQQECSKANAAKAYGVSEGDTKLASVSVTVQNTGHRAGDDVVQLFAVPPGAGTNGAPRKYLVGFNRVSLEPGHKTTVDFPLFFTAFSLVGSSGKRGVASGSWTFAVNYNSASEVKITVA